jgi:pimeloyl-ACP methyl ester carboxylesterase
MGLDAAIVSWRHALADLADDYRVIAVDFPGMGQSDSPAIDYTTTYYIEVVDRILDTLSLKNPVLGGVSMGGAVALGYTLEHPARIDQLVLVSSYGLGHEAPWRQAAYLGARAPFIDRAGQFGLGVLGAHPAFGTGLWMIAPTVPTDLATDMQEAAQDQHLAHTLGSWQRNEFRFDGFKTCYLDRLPEVEIPTLFVHGTADPIFPPAWSVRAAGRVSNSEVELVEGASHWVAREQPERFQQIMNQFLNS